LQPAAGEGVGAESSAGTTEEDVMKKILAALLVLSSPCALAQQVPIIEYESVPNPVKLPKDMHLGEVTGVAVNSKGNIYVFSRGNTTGPAYAAAAGQLLDLLKFFRGQ